MKKKKASRKSARAKGVVDGADAAGAVDAADAAKAIPGCTREQWIELNRLGKTRPFCSWYRQRDNDPL